jgi:hypothetical protein
LSSQPADTDDQQDGAEAKPFTAAKAHTAATAFAAGIDYVVATPAFSPFHECAPA